MNTQAYSGVVLLGASLISSCGTSEPPSASTVDLLRYVFSDFTIRRDMDMFLNGDLVASLELSYTQINLGPDQCREIDNPECAAVMKTIVSAGSDDLGFDHDVTFSYMDRNGWVLFDRYSDGDQCIPLNTGGYSSTVILGDVGSGELFECASGSETTVAEWMFIEKDGHPTLIELESGIDEEGFAYSGQLETRFDENGNVIHLDMVLKFGSADGEYVFTTRD